MLEAEDSPLLAKCMDCGKDISTTESMSHFYCGCPAIYHKSCIDNFKFFHVCKFCKKLKLIWSDISYVIINALIVTVFSVLLIIPIYLWL